MPTGQEVFEQFEKRRLEVVGLVLATGDDCSVEEVWKNGVCIYRKISRPDGSIDEFRVYGVVVLDPLHAMKPKEEKQRPGVPLNRVKRRAWESPYAAIGRR